MCMATVKRLIIKNGPYFVSTMVTSKPNLLHNTNWHHTPPQRFNVLLIIEENISKANINQFSLLDFTL